MAKKVLTPSVDTPEKSVEKKGKENVVVIGDFKTVIYSDTMSITELLIEAEKRKEQQEIKDIETPL